MKCSTLACVLAIGAVFGLPSYLRADDTTSSLSNPQTNLSVTPDLSIRILPSASNPIIKETDLRGAGIHRPWRFEFATCIVTAPHFANGKMPGADQSQHSSATDSDLSLPADIVLSSTRGIPQTPQQIVERPPGLLPVPASLPTIDHSSVIVQTAATSSESEPVNEELPKLADQPQKLDGQPELTNERNAGDQPLNAGNDQVKPNVKLLENSPTNVPQKPRGADVRISTLNERTAAGNQRRSPTEVSNKSQSTTSQERARKLIPLPQTSSKDDSKMSDWFFRWVVIPLVYLWITQFSSLMVMCNHDFSSPSVKRNWIIAFIVFFMVAPFAFIAWKLVTGDRELTAE